jgi:lysophospholipase L1-like esterase
MLAYARKFGFFQADAVVIVLNSMDIGDNPSGEAIVGVNPAFPARRPVMAIEELVRRYLWPRLKQITAQAFRANATLGGPAVDPQAEARRSVEDLKEICRLAASTGAIVLLAHFPSRTEVAEGMFGGHEVIAAAANDVAVPLVEMRVDLAQSIEAGHEPYRPNDTIHANAVGQQIIADALCEAILHTAAPH